MRIESRALLLVCLLVNAWACQNKSQQSLAVSGIYPQEKCVARLTEVIVYDIFSPPVASRLYAYANLAYYEAQRPAYPSAPAFLPQLKGFKPLPALPDSQSIHPELAGLVAFYRVSTALVFSKDSVRQTAEKAMELFAHLPAAKKSASMAWGEAMAKIILDRAALDHYKETRGMARYSVFPEKGKWEQTPPDYADATEPHWPKILPLLLDSARELAPPPPPAHDLHPGSVYYKELKEVYEQGKKNNPTTDTIARYWDDNPFVTTHTGHLTYANKKTTPVGHWMGIASIVTATASPLLKAKAFALSSAAIFDGFIACWAEKYHSRTIRPVSVIRQVWEPEWNPLLQTPPFPEYTSGHSVISAAAATVLENLLGTHLAFTDTTELPYLGMQRRFGSLSAAADEAGISRLYGGIHFRAAIEAGKAQGQAIGQKFNQTFTPLNNRPN